MPHDVILTPRLEAPQTTHLSRLVRQLDGHLEHPSGTPQPVPSEHLAQLGALLWDAASLDPTTIRDALAEAQDTEEPVRFLVQGEEGQHWPWEVLYHAHPDLGFLGQHPWCVVSRRVQTTRNNAPRLLPKPLRLLLFVAAPEDLDAERQRLDFEREEEMLFTALDRPLARGEVEIEVAEDGVLATLLTRLEEQRYHAVILSMHGTEVRDSQGHMAGGLVFEDAHTWRQAPVAGSTLTQQFNRLPSGHRPSLMILAACRSAHTLASAAPLSSVATQLHAAGVERVLGMRLSVLDSAASALNAALFQRLALGDAVGRAVTLARSEVAQGAWVQGQPHGQPGDPWAQWSLPVLYDRTQDGPLVEPQRATLPRQPRARATVLGGDGTVRLPSRAEFIGRRQEIRHYLRAFLEGETPRLLLTGPGGVGKTTLAGWLARTLGERYPETRILGFRAPFALDTLYEPLRQEAFDGTEEATLRPAIQTEPDQRERLRRLLLSLAQRQRPCAFVLDNLESIQELTSLTVAPQHADSLWLVHTICALPFPTRVLLTGRYAWPELSRQTAHPCPVPDAPYGDVLRRMQRLGWPTSMAASEKQQFYQTLGGNHRALEWAAQVLKHEPLHSEELVAALAAQHAPPDTPEDIARVVVEAMRENLLFTTHLRPLLSAAQDYLLRATSLYRVPVHDDGLLALTEQPDPGLADRQRLLAYSLLEQGHDPTLALDSFVVPPVVRELLRDHGFGLPASQALHRAMGRYHLFQGQYVSRRWSDNVEAIYHFRQAAEHSTADAVAEGVCRFYYGTSNFAAARTLTEEIVQRATPPAPWWALNWHGMCQVRLGVFESALTVFQQALPIAPTPREQGTTLNNLSQIYKAQGDYATA